MKSAPVNSFTVVPDGYKYVGKVPRQDNPFEYEDVYQAPRMTETQLLAQGIAFKRVQIDKFTVRDFYLN